MAGKTIIRGGTGFLKILGFLIIAAVAAWALAIIYCSLAAVSIGVLGALDLLFGTGFSPHAPAAMWTAWGAVGGAFLGFWTIAPIYGLRKVRPLILAIPIVLMVITAVICWRVMPVPPLHSQPLGEQGVRDMASSSPAANSQDPGLAAPSGPAGAGVQIYWRFATADYLAAHPSVTRSQLATTQGHPATLLRVQIENRSALPTEIDSDSFWLVDQQGQTTQAQLAKLPGLLVRSGLAPGASAQFWLLFDVSAIDDGSKQTGSRLECRSLPGAQVSLSRRARALNPGRRERKRHLP